MRFAMCFAILTACVRPPARPVSPLIATRPYEETVPQTIDPNKRYPLLLVLHGLDHSGADIERYYHIDPLVNELGLLVAYPNGTRQKGEHWYSGSERFWNATDLCCDFYGSGVDDVAYLDAVIDDMRAKYPVDPKRVFVAGLSNGSYMAYRYACDRADRVAAIVSHAGVMWSDTNRCHPSEPVAVLHIHGTADRFIPYDGGHVLEQGPIVVSAHQSVADWVAFDHCGPSVETESTPLDLVDEDTGAETTKEKWSGCRGVELWTLHGAEHSPRLQHPAWERAITTWLLAHPKP